jgi:hypothetical protein
MEAIMTRATNQRGVSLLLLVIMITAFAGVAVGVVTLLRSRHESYPYQVQSYQAYALAHAGAEFAMRFTRENVDANGGYGNFLQNYIAVTGGRVNFGNGTFTLRYVPWVPGSSANCGDDKLYSRGTCGTASREIELSQFGVNVSRPSGPLVNLVSLTATHYDDCAAGVCYSGSRLSLNICDPVLGTLPLTYGVPYGQIEGLYTYFPTYIAATRDGAGKQVTLAGVFGGGMARAGWLWDAACGDPASSPWVLCSTPGTPSTCTLASVGKYVAQGKTLPAWDKVNNPTPLASEIFQITPVPHSQWAYAHFPTSGNIGISGDRPRSGVPCSNNLSTCCDPNPNTCSLAPTDPNYFAPCCTGSYPPNPCCYDPQGFAGGSRSYPNGTVIDPVRAPTSAGYGTWLDRTAYTCSEYDFAGNQGHIFINLQAGGGYINIETIGDITPPVTIYFHFPYQPPDIIKCTTGIPTGCMSQYPPQYVTWVFTVN